MSNLRDLVQFRLHELMAAHKASLVGGSAKDMAEYNRMVGFVEGVTKAFTEIEGLLGDEDTEN